MLDTDRFYIIAVLLVVGTALVAIINSILRRIILRLKQSAGAEPIQWPGNSVITASVAGAYFINLFIIWIISNYGFDPFYVFSSSIAGPSSSRSDTLPEVLLTMIVVVCISLALARSARSLIGNLFFFTILLFAILILLLFQTPIAFWTVAVLLLLIVLRQLRHHYENLEPLSKAAQIVVVFSFFISGLHTLAEYLSPHLAATLYEQLDFLTLFRVRLTLAILFSTIVFLATGIATFHTFHFQYRDAVPTPQPPDRFWMIFYPFILVINLISNFIRWVGTFLATVIVESLRFLWKVIFSRPLWKAILYITATAISLFVLAADVLIVKPHLSAVIRNPSFLLMPNVDLAWANSYLGIAFVVAMLATLALAWLWLPRNASLEVRQGALSRIVISASAMYVCIFFATITYFPALNYIFSLHSSELNFPGVYTIFACLLAAMFSAVQLVRVRGEKEQT